MFKRMMDVQGDELRELLFDLFTALDEGGTVATPPVPLFPGSIISRLHCMFSVRGSLREDTVAVIQKMARVRCILATF